MAAHEEFEAFYERAYRLVVGQAFLLTGSRHEAEDIAQEALVRAASRWEQVRLYANPIAWVRRVALNLARDSARKARRSIFALSRLGTPPAVLHLPEDQVILVEALRRLPRRYRETLVLHYLVDMPVTEVAAYLALPEGTVKARLSRGRAALLGHLTGEPDPETLAEITKEQS